VVDHLSPASIVYSAGVGQDITFEHALVQRVGCHIQLFDPSPTGVATMALAANQHPLIHFSAIGLADEDGLVDFEPPADPAEGSYLLTTAGVGAATCHFPCKTLRSVMDGLGHTRIDLLKLDIEGFEYGILEQIVTDGLHVGQICVEVHPRIVPDGRRRTEALMASLARAHYRLIHREMNDLTFLWEQ